MKAHFIDVQQVDLKEDELLCTTRPIRTIYKGQTVCIQSFKSGILSQPAPSSTTSTDPAETDVDPLNSMQSFLTQVKQLDSLSRSECLVPCIGFALKECLVMTPYYPFGTLRHVIQLNQLTWTDKLTMARDMAEGMCFLTRRRLLQKPALPVLQRLFLTSESVVMEKENERWRCKVSDYWLLGFANSKQDKESYMAPELKENSSCVYKEACDVYAYGVILSEMATTEPCTVSVAHYLTGHYDGSEEPGFLSTCTMNALTKDVARRWSFNDIASHLQPAVSPKKSPLYPVLNSPQKEKHPSSSFKSILNISKTKAFSPSNLTSSALSADTHFPTEFSFQDPTVLHRKRQACSRCLLQRRTLIGAVALMAIVLVIVLLSVALRKPTSDSVPPVVMTTSSLSPTKTSTSLPTLPSSGLMQTGFPTDATIGRMWGGAAGSFLFALKEEDQQATLNQMVAAGLKIVRVVIKQVDANMKSSSAQYIPDVEQEQVGIYDDTVLNAIDKLMVKVKSANMKMIIAFHDNQCLGEYCEDVYCKMTGSTKSATAKFYSNTDATRGFDKRMEYILQHKNPYLNQQPWKSLSDVIWSFDIQNKPLRGASVTLISWLCDRAIKVRSLIDPNIHITSSQSAIVDDDVQAEFFTCPQVDINGIVSTRPSILTKALAFSRQYSKPIIIQDFWAPGVTAVEVNAFLSECNQQRVPWVLWGFSKPGLSKDYEFYATDTVKWQYVVSNGVQASQMK